MTDPEAPTRSAEEEVRRLRAENLLLQDQIEQLWRSLKSRDRELRVLGDSLGCRLERAVAGVDQDVRSWLRTRLNVGNGAARARDHDPSRAGA
ncbi:hypothetical protein [Spirillospora sp. NBC_01491]|uniref:hypothetical protein n=1 Tax=Spirillospora sp. NBC_01491 TaxID=2976007 RepID=UPI002E335F90|nr:hypothetical protein [Spirillospora sp. NBC_01491]